MIAVGGGAIKGRLAVSCPLDVKAGGPHPVRANGRGTEVTIDGQELLIIEGELRHFWASSMARLLAKAA